MDNILCILADEGEFFCIEYAEGEMAGQPGYFVSKALIRKKHLIPTPNGVQVQVLFDILGGAKMPFPVGDGSDDLVVCDDIKVFFPIAGSPVKIITSPQLKTRLERVYDQIIGSQSGLITPNSTIIQ